MPIASVARSKLPRAQSPWMSSTSMAACADVVGLGRGDELEDGLGVGGGQGAGHQPGGKCHGEIVPGSGSVTHVVFRRMTGR